jgi:hypothetical protein
MGRQRHGSLKPIANAGDIVWYECIDAGDKCAAGVAMVPFFPLLSQATKFFGLLFVGFTSSSGDAF